MFESLTKRFEKKEKPSFDDKKFQVEVVVKFKKFLLATIPYMIGWVIYFYYKLEH